MTTRTTRSQIRKQQIQIESSSINECGVFNIIETPYDGNCLFSSLFDFFNDNNDQLRRIPPTADLIRTETVDYILSRNSIGFQQNWDRFWWSINVNLEAHIANISEYAQNEKKDELIKEGYRRYMKQTKNFGTFSELNAAAELYGFQGYIFQHNDQNEIIVYEFGLTDNVTKPEVVLFFTGDVDSGHFRRLQPMIAPKTMQSGKYKVLNDQQPSTKITIKRVTEKGRIDLTSQPPPPPPRRVSCDVCNESFKTAMGLANHRKYHNEELAKQKKGNVTIITQQQSWSCDVSKQSFESARGLAIHRNRHVKQANEKTASDLNERLIGPSASNRQLEENAETPQSEPTIQMECNEWKKTFEEFENSETLDKSAFDEKVESFQNFIFKANQRLPGPQHPSIKFYRLRQQKKNRKLTSAQQCRSSNPQRTDAKAKQRRRDKYQYDLAQYWYYNQRKKAVRLVMTKDVPSQCKIKMEVMESHFRDIFGNKNNKTLESYPNAESHPDVIVSEEEIRKQIKKMPLDTSPGLDRVLAKTIRKLNVAKPISSLANTMLRHSYVPKGFRNGIMIFLDKEGDPHSVDNWRPIVIFSVIRRIIEKALDSITRDQVNINCNQRGFVSGLAGCHINARLVNACLKHAKIRKKQCITAFLDVSKAYDNIGHEHISKSLRSKGISENLHNLIMSLLSNNFVVLTIGKEISQPIQIKCGVPQGAPLSPILFNIAIDYLYEEICDPQYAQNNGYQLTEDYDPLCLTGFADDQAVTSESETHAIRTIELVKILLLKIGLKINATKSQAIIIRDGKLVEDSLWLCDGSEITGVKENERIKYLGCSFNSELVFDNSCIGKFNTNLNSLSTTSLLKPDQKLNIINQYIFPTLVYPLQAAPLNKIPAYVTDGLDVMIRRTVKEIIGLPMRTTDHMFYAPRRLRGLGLFRAAWEVYLQHFAIAKKLSQVNDELFQSISHCMEEMNDCVRILNVAGDSSKALRAELRNEAFEQWCNKKYQGSGVINFKNHTASNDFIYNKNSLSSSEWVSAIKLNCNYAALNAVPGVGSTSTLCRKCGRENETIAHVTGSCSCNNLLITSRHHSVKHSLTDLLKEKSFPCFEEVHAVDTDGHSRFSDIIAFHPKLPKAYIIDPTVRYETNNTQQDEDVQNEKTEIYEKCISFYEEKYANTFGKREWSVRGLWFGSRGSFGASVINFFDELKLDKSRLKSLSEEILIKTMQIITHHIYN